MSKALEFQDAWGCWVTVHEFNVNTEVRIELCDGKELVSANLSPNKTNELVKHLIEQLKSIGEYNP
jgi:hypothetical protein